MPLVNDQITDALTQLNAHMLASAPSHSVGLLDVTGAETLGMSMYNAVTAQQNAQTSSSASATATCAKILQTMISAPANPEQKASNTIQDTGLIAAQTAANILQEQLKKQNVSDQDIQKTLTHDIEEISKSNSIPGLADVVSEVTDILTHSSAKKEQ